MTISFAIIRQADGLVLRTGTASDPDHVEAQVQAGEEAREAPADVVPNGRWRCVGGGGFVEDAAAPASLADCKAALWESVKALRETCANSRVATPFGPMDADAESRANIAGAALAAMAAQLGAATFSVVWTTAENEAVTLDAAGMIAVGNAVTAKVNGAYQRARALRDQIDAAPDAATLDAIDITTGWPS